MIGSIVNEPSPSPTIPTTTVTWPTDAKIGRDDPLLGQPVLLNYRPDAGWSLVGGVGVDWTRVHRVGLYHSSVGREFRVFEHGLVELDTAQWDLHTGISGGLDPGQTYYVMPGHARARLVDLRTAVERCDVVCPVGRAVSRTRIYLLPFVSHETPTLPLPRTGGGR